MNRIAKVISLHPNQPLLPLKLRIANQYYYLRERLRGIPLPPTTMMNLVTGNYIAQWYVDSGARAAQSVRETIEKSHFSMSGITAILDFGCGCGRVLRHWKPIAQRVQLHGTDYNSELTYWARKTVPFAQIMQNNLAPPLAYADNTFDLIYALSTFTHWTVELQKRWIREFTRILKPQGFLLLTTHGDYYLTALTPDEQKLYQAGHPIVRYDEQVGTNTCGAFHPYQYVTTELRQNLTIEQFYPRSALGNPWQDIFLLRKPA